MKKNMFLPLLAALLLVGCDAAVSSVEVPNTSNEETTTLIEEVTTNDVTTENNTLENVTTENNTTSENDVTTENQPSSEEKEETTTSQKEYTGQISWSINFVDTTNRGLTANDLSINLYYNSIYYEEYPTIPGEVTYKVELFGQGDHAMTGYTVYYFTYEVITVSGEVLVEEASCKHNGSVSLPQTSASFSLRVGKEDIIFNVTAIADPTVEDNNSDLVLYTFEFVNNTAYDVESYNILRRSIWDENNVGYRSGEEVPAIGTYIFTPYHESLDTLEYDPSTDSYFCYDPVYNFTVEVYNNNVLIANTASVMGAVNEFSFTTSGGDIRIVLTITELVSFE